MVHHLSVLDVVDADLDLVQLVEDVNLGEGERRVSVDLTGEPQQGDVQPTTSPWSASRHSELSSFLLKKSSRLISKEYIIEADLQLNNLCRLTIVLLEKAHLQL